MSDYDSDTLRLRGNNLFKTKDFDGAIRCYSDALDVDPYNPKLFSNRCSAYLSLHKYEDALADAKRCVSIDPDWYKGYVQLGSCYLGLKNYKESIDAYKKALPLADSKETIQELIDKVTEKQSQNTFYYRFLGNSVAILNSMEGILKVLLCVFTIVSILPIRSPQVKLRALFFSFYLGVVLISVYRFYGKPVLRKDYWRRVVGDTLVLFLLPLSSFRRSPVMSTVMMMISLYILPSTARFFSGVLDLISPDLNKRCVDAVNQAMIKVMPEQNWMTRTPEEKEYMANKTFRVASGTLELMLLPMSLLELRNGMKGLIVIVMMWQYLVIRVSVSEEVSNALRSVDISLNQLIWSNRCPQVIRNAYQWIREKIVNLYNRTLRT